MLSLLSIACATSTTGLVIEVRGTVLDPEWKPIADAEISLVNDQGAWMGTTTSDAEGSWGLPVIYEEEGEYAVEIHATRGGRANSVVYTTVLVRGLPDPIPLRIGPGQRLAMAEVPVAPVVLPLEGEGSGSGRVIDGLTGETVPRLQLSVQRGWNAPADAAVVAQGATDHDGDFDFELASGVYTVRSEEQEGYSATVFPLVVDPDGVPYQRGFVVPPPGEPELSVLLAWDGAVAELDLHVTGPKAGAEELGRYNIYEGDPFFPVSGDPVAELVHTSPGFESIRVNHHVAVGAYRASAFDPEAELGDGSDRLSRSAAMIWIWWEEEVWFETAPYGVEANAWKAMELEVSDGSLTRLQLFADSAEETDDRDF